MTTRLYYSSTYVAYRSKLDQTRLWETAEEAEAHDKRIVATRLGLSNFEHSMRLPSYMEAIVWAYDWLQAGPSAQEEPSEQKEPAQ